MRKRSSTYILILLALTSGLVSCQKSFKDENTLAETSSTPAILGGEVTVDRRTPASRSLVLIELLDYQGTALSFCSASLIGPHTILTAGHCFSSRIVGPVRGFRVLFENAYFKNQNTEPFVRKSREGLVFATNPDYNSSGSYDHDIALGIFSGDIPAGFAPVNIDDNTQANYANERVYAYGYGRRQDYTGIPGESRLFSSGVLARGILKVSETFGEMPDRYFTTETGPSHLCQGDSGGPQFLDKNGVVKIVGVNSASFGNLLRNGIQSCSGKSQATRVAPFAHWLRDEEQYLLSNYYH